MLTNTDILSFHVHVRDALHLPLPGIDAQRKLAIVGRQIYSRRPDDAKQAAVCVVIYPHEKTVRIAYIQRSQHKNDRHSGQISFPGGQVEDSDTDLIDTALRELKEETNILATREQVLGSLTSLYIPVSNFLVHPYVIGLEKKPEVLRQEDEVADIFGFGLSDLLVMEIKKKQISGYGFTIPSAPYFDLDGRTLWGATAMMTNEFLNVVRSMERL